MYHPYADYTQNCSLLAEKKYLYTGMLVWGFKLPVEWNKERVEKATRKIIARCLENAPLLSDKEITNIGDADMVFLDETFAEVGDVIQKYKEILPDAKILATKAHSTHLYNYEYERPDEVKALLTDAETIVQEASKVFADEYKQKYSSYYAQNPFLSEKNDLCCALERYLDGDFKKTPNGIKRENLLKQADVLEKQAKKEQADETAKKNDKVYWIIRLVTSSPEWHYINRCYHFTFADIAEKLLKEE